MKKKHQINISTASLRSSSSRRSRRSTTNPSSNPKPSSKSIHKRQSNLKHSIKKGRIIGKSSKKSFHCNGCNNTFNIYPSTNAFLNLHVKSNDHCPTAYPKCFACGKLFFEEKHLISHQSKSSKKHSVMQNISEPKSIISIHQQMLKSFL